MKSPALNAPLAPIEYPEDDGNPMAENTLQFEWIVTIQGGLNALFAKEPSVFVAGDLLWYPVEGQPQIRTAPDAMVVFGRPKGYRGSYRQWEEENIAPQVVFEVLSPGNRRGEMDRKQRFYESYGVQEYYIYDPELPGLAGFLREGEELKVIEKIHGWHSPRLGIRFDFSAGDLRLFHPNGEPFLTFQELAEERDLERERAEKEHDRAERERDRAELERERAEQERERADQERKRAQLERERAERMAALLRSMGVDPDR